MLGEIEIQRPCNESIKNNIYMQYWLKLGEMYKESNASGDPKEESKDDVKL